MGSSKKMQEKKKGYYDVKQGWVDVFNQVTGSSGRRQKKKIDDGVNTALGKKKK